MFHVPIVKYNWRGKDIRGIAAEIYADSAPLVMVDIWQIALDNWWHVCDDRCVVCRSIPCNYTE